MAHAEPVRSRMQLHASISALAYGELEERRKAALALSTLPALDGSTVEPAVDAVDEAGAERIWLEARDLQPPAGTAHVDSPHRGRAAAHGGLRRAGTSQSSADLLAARH